MARRVYPKGIWPNIKQPKREKRRSASTKVMGWTTTSKKTVRSGVIPKKLKDVKRGE